MSQALQGVVQGVKSESKSFSNGVKGLVLCGGEGARLRPLTYYFQKSMIPIGSKQRPLLEFIVRSLKRNEITDICFLVGYKWEQVSNYFDDGTRFGVKIARYVRCGIISPKGTDNGNLNNSGTRTVKAGMDKSRFDG